MFDRILVIGATGLLGRPVVNRLTEGGQAVRILTRSVDKAHTMFGGAVEVTQGSATDIDDVRSAMQGCDAVHINLTPATEYIATKNVIEVADGNLGRLGYVSATTLSEELRWFHRVDVKMRTEQLVRDSGLPYAIFCPTWVMETLQNFVRGGKWALSVDGKNPPQLHWFAAADFGRMVAASYEDGRALGQRLFVYGPEGVTIGDAMDRFAATCYPEARVVHLKVWQARLLAKLIRNTELAEVAELIGYLDTAGEFGEPEIANELYGAPAITLDDWFGMPRDEQGGFAH
ncbi:MAG: NAD(P)H-binding protein [Acidimicrobiia bacterium]|nr:NAD(P)H-binding protein [Acidimicrobiia bacterium]MDJ0665405.1 NAD(P)H-binding protein [Acidimicrobiia bacterium]